MPEDENEQDANPLAAVMRLSEQLEAVLDDPDAEGTPEQFIAALRNIAEELSSNAERVTVEDFQAEYTEEPEADALDASSIF